jgi:Ca-activated chloride channel family protein
MSLLWPRLLWALALVPLFVAAYIWAQRRKHRATVRFSSLSLLREAMPAHAWWRRHLPAVLVLAGLTMLTLALSRPVSILSVPAGQTTIVLALDVSRSMCSTDIIPNRLEAAKAAALSFVESQDRNTQIGLVAFSGFAELVQPPTTDKEALAAAIRSLLTGRRTAVGSGMLRALEAVAEADESIPPPDVAGSGLPPVTPVPAGAYAPAIIILLTDGASNTGPLPQEVAAQAAARGVRVYAIGFGTEQGAEFSACGQRNFGFEPFGGAGQAFGGGGGFFRRGIDEETLKEVAAITGAEYYSAESAGELRQVFHDLPTTNIVKHETTELTGLFVLGAAVLVTIALALSLIWHPLP